MAKKQDGWTVPDGYEEVRGGKNRPDLPWINLNDVGDRAEGVYVDHRKGINKEGEKYNILELRCPDGVHRVLSVRGHLNWLLSQVELEPFRKALIIEIEHKPDKPKKPYGYRMAVRDAHDFESPDPDVCVEEDDGAPF